MWDIFVLNEFVQSTVVFLTSVWNALDSVHMTKYEHDSTLLNWWIHKIICNEDIPIGKNILLESNIDYK